MKYLFRIFNVKFIVLSGLVFLCSCSVTPTNSETRYGYKVINAYPHDQDAYTQGLAFEDGFLYEGTGRHGRSQLRKVELETGNILQTHRLSSEFFGEGITICGDRLIQLTWLSQTGFAYDKAGFKLLATFKYPTKGWGLTYDGEKLILSDGTSRLYFLNPGTYKQTGYIDVHDKTGPVKKLNELEFINGRVYANILDDDRIAIIDPTSGRVSGWIDLTGLLDTRAHTDAVLNGIAWDGKNNRLFVTGKLWPKLFYIEIVETK